MVATARRADRVLLHNISWDQFERLLTDLGESRDGDYVEASNSLALPQLAVYELPHLIETHRAEGRRAVRKAVRGWAKEHKP